MSAQEAMSEPVIEPSPPLSTSAPAALRAAHLLVLSAPSEAALTRALGQLREYLQSHEGVDLNDLAYTLQLRARGLAYRAALICSSRAEALGLLEESGSKGVFLAHTSGAARPVVLLLPGVGDQYVGMGHELYESSAVFKRELDRCAQILSAHLGLDIREILYPVSGAWKKARSAGKGIDLKRMLAKGGEAAPDAEASRLNRTRYAQPALFSIEYATARLLQSLGVEPDALVGHSMGEYVAACLAGVFSLEDALRLIAVRARLVDNLAPGAMLCVLLSEQELAPLLGAELSISLLNGPNNCVVAGPLEAIEALEQRLSATEVICRRVQNGHAFHTPALVPILEEFLAEARQVRFSAPRIPYSSNVLGDWITAGFGSEAGYWGKHATHTARFSDTLARTWNLGDPILIECGPGRTLSTLAAQHPGRKVGKLGAIFTLRQSYENEADEAVLLRAIGKIWLSGAALDFKRLERSPSAKLLEDARFGEMGETGDLFEPGNTGNTGEAGATGSSAATAAAAGAAALEMNEAGAAGRGAAPAYVAPRNDLEVSLARVCERVLGLPRVGITDNFFELGGHSLAVIRLVMEMKQVTGLEIDLGEVFRTPTIAELVLTLGPNAKKNAAIVVPLQPKGDAVPIFCICGLDIYREFAASVGENQPVCGVYVDEERAIIDEVMDGKTSGVSIDRLVDAYDAAIARFCPQGPYRLAGLSFGGMLAVELASKMRRRGDAVEVVFLFDTLLPEGRRRLWGSWLRRQVKELAGPAGRAKLARLYEKLRRRLLAKTAPVSAPPPKGNNAAFYQEFAGRQRAAFFEAEKSWQVRSEIDFPVVLFRAAEHDMWGEDLSFAEDYGWRRYVGENLHILKVMGGHRSLIGAPHVANLGRLARQFLNNAGA
jgi:malonyl CoA-acyl carrier protein transacylase/thioesterase domain-containing protein/acyl carrier protein